MTGIASAVQAARAAVNGLLTDDELACTVIITADTEGTADDILDEDTLELRPAADDTDPVYTGPAMLSAAATRQEPRDEGGAPAYPVEIWCRLPVTAPPVKVGHRVHVDVAPNDALVGEDYVVDEIPTRAIQVTRRFLLRRTSRGPRR